MCYTGGGREEAYLCETERERSKLEGKSEEATLAGRFSL